MTIDPLAPLRWTEYGSGGGEGRRVFTSPFVSRPYVGGQSVELLLLLKVVVDSIFSAVG